MSEWAAREGQIRTAVEEWLAMPECDRVAMRVALGRMTKLVPLAALPPLCRVLNIIDAVEGTPAGWPEEKSQ